MPKKPRIDETTIGALHPDTRNANRHTSRGTGLIEDSLRRHGAGRSVLLDKKGKIIAGNATAEAAGSIGMDDVILVQTDGTKLVAVQRTDLDLDKDPRAREMAIADNRSSQIDLQWDPKLLKTFKEEGVDLDSAGIKPEELEELLASAVEDEDEATPAEQPKSPTLFITLNKEQRATLDKAAEARGLKTSTWARAELIAVAKRGATPKVSAGHASAPASGPASGPAAPDPSHVAG